MDDALTDSTYLILLTLLTPQHGYAIMKEVSTLTEGSFEIGPASMYTILKKLVKNEYIVLEESDDRKKVYMITALGKSRLEEDIQRRKQFYLIGQQRMKEGEHETVE